MLSRGTYCRSLIWLLALLVSIVTASPSIKNDEETAKEVNLMLNDIGLYPSALEGEAQQIAINEEVALKTRVSNDEDDSLIPEWEIKQLPNIKILQIKATAVINRAKKCINKNRGNIVTEAIGSSGISVTCLVRERSWFPFRASMLYIIIFITYPQKPPVLLAVPKPSEVKTSAPKQQISQSAPKSSEVNTVDKSAKSKDQYTFTITADPQLINNAVGIWDKLAQAASAQSPMTGSPRNQDKSFASPNTQSKSANPATINPNSANTTNVAGTNNLQIQLQAKKYGDADEEFKKALLNIVSNFQMTKISEEQRKKVREAMKIRGMLQGREFQDQETTLGFNVFVKEGKLVPSFTQSNGDVRAHSVSSGEFVEDQVFKNQCNYTPLEVCAAYIFEFSKLEFQKHVIRETFTDKTSMSYGVEGVGRDYGGNRAAFCVLLLKGN